MRAASELAVRAKGDGRHLEAAAAGAHRAAGFPAVDISAGATDFTRPGIRYDPSNCFMYIGWNQRGEKTLELTNPDYNPCMGRAALVGGSLPAILEGGSSIVSSTVTSSNSRVCCTSQHAHEFFPSPGKHAHLSQ